MVSPESIYFQNYNTPHRNVFANSFEISGYKIKRLAWYYVLWFPESQHLFSLRFHWYFEGSIMIYTLCLPWLYRTTHTQLVNIFPRQKTVQPQCFYILFLNMLTLQSSNTDDIHECGVGECIKFSEKRVDLIWYF